MSRFAPSSKNCDFSCLVKNRKSDDFLRYLRFFSVLCHVNNHWSSERVVDLTRFAKIAKKIAILTILRVTCDFSQFFVLLISSLFCPKSFRFTVSAIKAYLYAKASAANLLIKVCYLKVRVIFVRFHCISSFNILCYTRSFRTRDEHH